MPALAASLASVVLVASAALAALPAWADMSAGRRVRSGHYYRRGFHCLLRGLSGRKAWWFVVAVGSEGLIWTFWLVF